VLLITFSDSNNLGTAIHGDKVDTNATTAMVLEPGPCGKCRAADPDWRCCGVPSTSELHHSSGAGVVGVGGAEAEARYSEQQDSLKLSPSGVERRKGEFECSIDTSCGTTCTCASTSLAVLSSFPLPCGLLPDPMCDCVSSALKSICSSALQSPSPPAWHMPPSPHPRAPRTPPGRPRLPARYWQERACRLLRCLSPRPLRSTSTPCIC
jgi:hypothetical protein